MNKGAKVLSLGLLGLIGVACSKLEKETVLSEGTIDGNKVRLVHEEIS